MPRSPTELTDVATILSNWNPTLCHAFEKIIWLICNSRKQTEIQNLKVFKYGGEWEFQQRAAFHSLQEIHLSVPFYKSSVTPLINSTPSVPKRMSSMCYTSPLNSLQLISLPLFRGTRPLNNKINYNSKWTIWGGKTVIFQSALEVYSCILPNLNLWFFIDV
jgi:hypothetical protein